MSSPPATSPYAELQCCTAYSFLRGASHPRELVERAAELGLAALAITDFHSLSGVVQAHLAARERGLSLVVGARLAPTDAPELLCYPTDRAAYGRLSRLITRGRLRAEKGRCDLCFDDLAEHAAGLLAIALPASDPRNEAHERGLARCRELFGPRLYLGLARHLSAFDTRRLAWTLDLSQRLGIDPVVVNDVHYHDRSRQPIQNLMTALRTGRTLRTAGYRLFSNAERHLKSPAQMAALFPDQPAALERTLELARAARFSLDELRYEFPRELVADGRTPTEQLAFLVFEAARRRYGSGEGAALRARLEHELALIAELRYEGFFLTVHDIVRFARSRGILCQGRGSAANSAVCFVLGITAVDPERIDLLFERFISRERHEPPDIDVDFEHERREEVIQYIYGRYGRERAALTAAVIRYRPRGAVRDAGRAHGLEPALIDRLARTLDHHEGRIETERLREAGLDPAEPRLARVLADAQGLLGLPRHLSQHVGGFVIGAGPVSDLAPIENAAATHRPSAGGYPGRTVIQWDKDDLEALGILKVDVLALGMLTALRKTFELVERHEGPRLSLEPGSDDPAVFDMLCQGDSVGVFQVESRAQMTMLPRLQPRCFYDLVVEVAIVRPGPISGGLVHPYLRRRAGQEPVDYPSPAVRGVLEKTLGVPIFQEQVMRLAVVAAGFTPGQADELRRAMGNWRDTGKLEPFRRRLLQGLAEHGYPERFARQIYESIRGFGQYGFPESHAASFALLTYVSAWLKRHHPAAFFCALLNSQPMGFYAPAQLVRAARAAGVEVRPVDIQTSAADCTLEPPGAAGSQPALRLGLRLVQGLASARLETLARARAAGPFASIRDVARRTGLPQDALARLAAAGAFSTFAQRRAALWQVLRCAQDQGELPLLEGVIEQETEAPVELPAPSPLETAQGNYRALGLSLGPHPLGILRPIIEALGTVTARRLNAARAGETLAVAGLVICRQRPATASGVVFYALEDETGTANIIVPPEVFERHRHAARQAGLLLARGRVRREGRVVHLQAQTLTDLSRHLPAPAGYPRSGWRAHCADQELRSFPQQSRGGAVPAKRVGDLARDIR